MKILLAEDEKDMSAALVAILTHSGYEVDPDQCRPRVKNADCHHFGQC